MLFILFFFTCKFLFAGASGQLFSLLSYSVNNMEGNARKDLKESLCDPSQLVQEGYPCIYRVDMKETFRDDEGCIGKLEFGEGKMETTEKVVMLVGATGSGKTTLINGLVNFIFGVKWNDPFRLKIILEDKSANQAKSQTKGITSYTLHHQEGFHMPYSLTIIDTPGFGDTQGVERDKQIIQQIRKFFTTPGEGGISHIDAVGFVAQSSQARLTPMQTYIFDNILSLFGKDIADNIFLLLTFADGQKPQVLSAVNEAKIPYKKHFQFNNSALYSTQSGFGGHASDDEGYENLGSMFWEMGNKSFRFFLQQIISVERKSLILTKDVLEERNRIEVYVEGIQKDIKVGLSTLETLNKEMKVLKEHEADIDRNKNFEYEVEEDIFEMVNIAWDRVMTNCLVCKRTCHPDCQAIFSPLLFTCWAMGWDGRCKICPLKCKWLEHKSCNFMFDVKRVTSKRTVEEIRLRYKEATQKKLSAQNLTEKVKQEFGMLQQKILGMTESVRKSLQKLKKIALRPDPLTAVEYIDTMIESEKNQAKPGWLERVQQLSKLREKAGHMQNISDQGFDPFKEYQNQME